MPPLAGSQLCFSHDPEHARVRAAARKLGGHRRRRSKAAGSDEAIQLDSVTVVRRLLERAVMDALALENSVARARVLAHLASVALKTLEVGELEQRVAALESQVTERLKRLRSVS